MSFLGSKRNELNTYGVRNILDFGRESIFKRQVARMTMRSITKCTVWAVLLTAMMLTSVVQLPTEVSEEIETSETTARQNSVEAACEGLTFEDMFNYTHAIFDIVVDDDWNSAQVSAVAWINGTLSDQVRMDLENLFEGLPGGDNGWLSSDEYNAIENIAADCVEQTNPRVGFRNGPAHRGGDGVNWYNATWENTEENPLTIEEYNLMPQNHVDERSCESSPNNNCVEIPVVPVTPGRNCDTTVNHPDECRIIVWLNGTFVFNGMTLGGDYTGTDFTVAMNTSNMTNADLAVTYPALDGLRVGMFEECDGRLINQENNDNQGTAPTVGTCTSDGTITQESRLISIGGETRLRVDAHVEFDMDIWPTGQDMFFDMTTEPPEVDDPPVWTASAPSDGDIMPIADDGVAHFLSTSQMSSWATDDQGAPLISCDGAEGWSMSSDADGLSADSPAGQDSTSITCHAIDSAGQTTDVRSYTLQVPLRVTATASSSSASVVVTPTAGMPSMSAVVTLVQDDAQTSSNSVDVNGETTVNVDLSAMSPGPFMVRVSASGAGMADFSHTYDLGTAKESSPPSLTVAMGEWIGENYELTGQFNDPDGDPVTISATDNGNAWGTIQVSGNQWMAVGSGIPNSETNNIILTACDNWGQCTSVTHEAGATPGNDVSTPPPVVDSGTDEGGGLPGFGMFAALGAIALAGLGRRRQD
ncbi:MAG: hypothetical protein VYA86_05270 [Candidatus Thermoplasmatota archaeon]|nr:hypothetical protein [Candidatus Thermoplasmatota archaeon]